MLKKFSTFANPTDEIKNTSILEQKMPVNQLESLLVKDHNISMLDNFSKNYSIFSENIKKIDYFSEQLELLSETAENSVKRTELEELFTTHLLIVNESIQEIKTSLSGINQKDLSTLSESISFVNNKTDQLVEFIGEELPKHNKRYKNLEFFVDEKINSTKEELSEFIEISNSNFDTIVEKMENLADEVSIPLNEKYNTLTQTTKSTLSSIDAKIKLFNKSIVENSEFVSTLKSDISEFVKDTIDDSSSNLKHELVEFVSEITSPLSEETHSALSVINGKIKSFDDLIEETQKDNSKFKFELTETLQKNHSTLTEELQKTHDTLIADTKSTLSVIDGKIKSFDDLIEEAKKDNSKLKFELIETLQKNHSTLTEDTKTTLFAIDAKIKSFDEFLEENDNSNSEFKYKLTGKLQEVYDTIKIVNEELAGLELKYDETINPALDKINVFEHKLSNLDSIITVYGENVQKVKDDFRKIVTEVNTVFLNEKYVELDEKTRRIEEIFELMINKELLLKEYNDQEKSYSQKELQVIVQNAIRATPNTQDVSNFNAVSTKLRYLEQTISQIAYGGMGSGEVNLRWLDDVDYTTIEDGKILRYNDASKKFEFVDSINLKSISLTGTTETLTASSGIDGWTYSGKSFLVTAQETGTTQTGMHFSSDGLNMYIVGSGMDTIYQYTLTTAWDISTAAYASKSFSIATQAVASSSVRSSSDGLIFYILDDTTDSVYQYTLTTAWDISTAAYASKSFSVTTEDVTPQGLEFSADGTNMYVCGQTTDTIYQYTLTTAWDISTAAYASKSFSISVYEGTSTGISFNTSGTKLYFSGSASDAIHELVLTTAWDLSTATYIDKVLIYATGIYNADTSRDLYVNADNNVAYVLDATSGRVFQWSTNTTPLKVSGDKLVVSPSTTFKDNVLVGGIFRSYGVFQVNGGATFTSTLTVNSTLTSAGTLSASSTVTLGGSTTSVTSIGTSATTGSTQIGGSSQTGTITVGQSTVSQTVQIGSGATTAVSTKTINIGTNGVSGSNTNINIGSAVAGANGVITTNYPIKLKGYTVATLPPGTVGMVAYVTDATAPTYLGTLTGNGSIRCPVFHNGTAWVSH